MVSLRMVRQLAKALEAKAIQDSTSVRVNLKELS